MKNIPPVKILLVQNKPGHIPVIESIIEHINCDIIIVHSSAEAIYTLEHEAEIGLILLESEIGGDNSYETAQLINSHERYINIPVLFIIENVFSWENKFPDSLKGIYDFITLPINPDLLKIKINTFVELFRKNKQLLIQEAALKQISQDLEVQKNERQIVEEELRLKNLQLSEALNLTHLGSWDWNIATNRIKCSEEIYNIFDMDKDNSDFTMEALLERVHPGDMEKVKSELNDAIMDKKSFDLYFRHISPNNQVRIINNKGKIVTNTQNEVQKIFGTSQDITELKKTEEQLKIFYLMEKMLNEIFIFNWMDFSLLYANADALRSLGLCITEVREKHIYDLLLDFNKTSFRRLVTPLLKGKKDKIVFYSNLLRKDNSTYPVEIHVQLIDQDDRKIFLAVVLDLTERRRSERELSISLKEKDILLKEIHHRVKNNLQIVYSLLNLQSATVTDEKVLNIFKESQNRIKSMALIHEKLYKHNNLSRIDFSEYLDDLVSSLIFSYRVNTSNVDVRINTPQIFLNIDVAISLGLCVTELISNCFKYAFLPGEKGLVKVVIEINSENILTLCIMDTGGKLPGNFDVNETESLGLKLVVSLAEQHHGFLRTETGGTTSFIIEIPLKDYSQNSVKQSMETREPAIKETA